MAQHPPPPLLCLGIAQCPYSFHRSHISIWLKARLLKHQSQCHCGVLWCACSLRTMKNGLADRTSKFSKNGLKSGLIQVRTRVLQVWFQPISVFVHFSWRIILRPTLPSDFGGLPVQHKFSTLSLYFHRVVNLHTQDWSTFNVFAMNRCVQLLLVEFIIILFCFYVNSLHTILSTVQSHRLSKFTSKLRH